MDLDLFSILVAFLRHFGHFLIHSILKNSRVDNRCTTVYRRTNVAHGQEVCLLGVMELAALLCLLVIPLTGVIRHVFNWGLSSHL